MDIGNGIKKILISDNEIPNKDTHDILEFLEHDEWGVAFEVLCSVIEQENLSINESQYNEIIDIGREMDMDDTLWVRIEPEI
jgi:hypothetical protein